MPQRRSSRQALGGRIGRQKGERGQKRKGKISKWCLCVRVWAYVCLWARACTYVMTLPSIWEIFEDRSLETVISSPAALWGKGVFSPRLVLRLPNTQPRKALESSSERHPQSFLSAVTARSQLLTLQVTKGCQGSLHPPQPLTGTAPLISSNSGTAWSTAYTKSADTGSGWDAAHSVFQMVLCALCSAEPASGAAEKQLRQPSSQPERITAMLGNWP